MSPGLKRAGVSPRLAQAPWRVGVDRGRSGDWELVDPETSFHEMTNRQLGYGPRLQSHSTFDGVVDTESAQTCIVVSCGGLEQECMRFAARRPQTGGPRATAAARLLGTLDPGVQGPGYHGIQTRCILAVAHSQGHTA